MSAAVAQEQPAYHNPMLAGDTITVAAVNVPSVKYDFEGGVALAKKIVEEAKADGATYIAFPETWLPGFINSDEGTIAGGPPKDLAQYVENCIEPGSDK